MCNWSACGKNVILCKVLYIFIYIYIYLYIFIYIYIYLYIFIYIYIYICLNVVQYAVYKIACIRCRYKGTQTMSQINWSAICSMFIKTAPHHILQHEIWNDRIKSICSVKLLHFLSRRIWSLHIIHKCIIMLRTRLFAE